MRITGTVLYWLGCVYMAAVAAAIALLCIIHIAASETVWDGISDVQGWFSPFNVANLFVTGLALLPGFLLVAAGTRLRSACAQ